MTFNSTAGRGGGATSYLDRVIRTLSAHDDLRIVHLSSGTEYTANPKNTFYRQLASVGRVDRFEIVNSPVLAPAHLNMGNPMAAVEDTLTRDIFLDFIAKHGPFDVVHFNSIEGLSFRCLELKSEFPNLRIVLSLHDYYPFCPSVKLWRDGKENCTDNEEGRKCVSCPHTRVSTKAYISTKQIYSSFFGAALSDYDKLQRASIATSLYAYPIFSSAVRAETRRSGKSLSRGTASVDSKLERGYRAFLERGVEIINREADTVIAVSKRVMEIAQQRGISAHKIKQQYIGTANGVSPKLQRAKEDGAPMCIAFLGFATPEKGFFFFLDCLELLSSKQAKSIDVVVAARCDSATKKRLRRVGNRFHSFKHYDGYRAESLSEILQPVHLGIVPTLWEDNLPQVALEFAGHGIPVLSSNLGGSKEIGNCSDFVFTAGSTEDFNNKLCDIFFSFDSLAQKYFRHSRKFPDNAMHGEGLLQLYNSPTRSYAGVAQ